MITRNIASTREEEYEYKMKERSSVTRKEEKKVNCGLNEEHKGREK